MKFDVLNRFSGKVKFTAKIACKPDASNSVKLGLALKWAIKARADLAYADLAGANLARANLARANLAGVNLAGANLARAKLADAYLAHANLAGAHLARANLTRAHLVGANLPGADLTGANLTNANLAAAYLADVNLAGANLAGAYLAGADLARANLADQWIIQGTTRSDGYAFFLQKLKDDKEPMVKTGCHYFTLAQAQQHWETTRKGETLLTEIEIIVRSMVEVARARGLMK